MDSKSILENYVTESTKAIGSITNQFDKIIELVRAIVEVLSNGGCIFWVGNGGSAAEAQHLSAELVGRFEINRKPLKSLAITTDTSVLTAIGNDFGFEEVFKRQIEALVSKRDLVVFISTSGKSLNIIEGLRQARKVGCKTAALTGRYTLDCDYSIEIDSPRTCHIQEGHLVVGQLVCSLIEIEIRKKSSDYNK